MFSFNQEIPSLGWWIEICTNHPFYLYYFGPFDSREEATLKSHGFIHDLREEKAEILSLQIELTRPDQLTICLSEVEKRLKHISQLTYS